MRKFPISARHVACMYIGSADSSKFPLPIPVSYTHLDVYKRQPISPARKPSATITNSTGTTVNATN